MIGEGVRILNIEGTVKSLDEIVESCQEASMLLGIRESRPASSMIIDIRKRFESFREELDALVATVPPVSRYTSYTSLGSSTTNFVIAYSADVLKWRDAHLALLNSLTGIDKTLESLDQQLYQEPTVDVDKIREELSKIHRLVSSTQATLDARQSAILRTLKRFESE